MTCELLSPYSREVVMVLYHGLVELSNNRDHDRLLLGITEDRNIDF